MIEEAYCSFEVAKLLKEKGFDESCRSYFINDLGDYRKCAVGITNRNCSFEQILRPTHQLVMKWLREEKKIYIRIIEDAFGENYHFEIYSKNPNSYYIPNYYNNTYEEAVEAALKYSLENLI